MYDDNLNAPPLNSLPWVVILLSCLVGGVELIFQAAEAGFIGGAEGIGWRLIAVQNYAFSDKIFDWMRLTGQYPAQHMVRLFSYTFIHQSIMHAIFALVFILAIGKFVAEIMHPVAVLAIFFLSAAIGAAIISITLDDPQAMIGAYPAVYGLLGAFTWLRFSQLTAEGENEFRAFTLIFALIGITVIFTLVGWLFEGFQVGSPSNWLTRLAGFCVGFALTVVLAPDGKQRLQTVLVRLRQR